MLPSIYSENLFDDFFSDPFDMVMPRSLNALYGKHGKNLMKTDVRETEDTYELDIDLPGFKKEEVNHGAEGRLSHHSGRKGSGQGRAGKEG